MRKICLLVAAIIVLGGCAQSTSSSLTGQLNYAYRSANATLEMARELSPGASEGDTLAQATSLLESTRKAQKESPSYKQLKSYARVKEQAVSLLTTSLKRKFNAREERLSELEKTIETVTGQFDDLSGRLEKFAQERTSLEDSVKTLREKFRRETEQLTKTIKDQQDIILQLKSRLDASNQKIVQLNEKLENQRREISSLQNKYKQTMDEVSQLREQNQEIVKLTRERLREGKVERRDGQVFITFRTDLLFGFGSAYIQEDARDQLDEVAKILKSYPDRPVRVYGHSDSTPVSADNPYQSNWELSSQRAINVLKYLAYGRDVSKQRIGAVAFADRWPVASNDSPESRAENRRVEVVLLPKNRRMISPNFQIQERKTENLELMKRFRNSIQERNLRVEKGSLYVNLTDQLTFPTARATLGDEDRAVLDELGPILEEYSDRPIRIQGHTDDLPMADNGRYESNWELSAARSINVVKYLIDNFDLSDHQVGASAMGQFHPLVPNTSEANRARNRRVEIMLLPRSVRTKSLDVDAKVR